MPCNECRFCRENFLVGAELPGGVEIVADQAGWLADKAQPVSEAMLQAHPDINVLWAANEGGTVAHANAVKTLGLSGKVFVFGTDMNNQMGQMLQASDDMLYHLAVVLKEVLLRVKKCLKDPPYNFLIHTIPNVQARHKHGSDWETIEMDYHWHIEFIPRLTHVAGFEWGTGFYINPTAPEEAARYLRLMKKPVYVIVAGECWENRNEYDRLIEKHDLRGLVRFDARYIPYEDVSTYFSAADVLVANRCDLATAGQIERMKTGMKRSLDYFQANFSPYQFRQLRFQEFPEGCGCIPLL